MTDRRRKRTDRHLNRKELLIAAGKDQEMTGHLRTCEDCREAVELLRAFHMAGRLALPEPPAGWVAVAAEIPKRSWRTEALAQIKAVLTFDSWLSPHLVGVRGLKTSTERRICCEAGAYLLDLRAEKRPEGWRMVAQLAGESADQAELVAGRKVVPADPGALFQWSSARPPSEISVRVGNQNIKVPKLSWKRPRKT